MKENATDEGLAAFGQLLGHRLTMPAKKEPRFELSATCEAERIWQRLRRCQYRDDTKLKLACIL